MSEKMPWYMKNSSVGKAFNHFAIACKEKSVFDDKTRELLMLALACVFRCPHCVETRIKNALKAGCTKQEVTEALLIAAYEAAGTQLAWRKEIYEKYLGDDEE